MDSFVKQKRHKSVICGVDEVGRGCIFGPVYASCVSFTTRPSDALDLADSKSLSEKKRETCLAQLRDSNQCMHTVGLASAQEIDTYNIHNASLLAMRRALLRMTRSLYAVHYLVLVDGIFSPFTKAHDNISVCSIAKGDTIIPEIQAASIIAKVYRDASMRDYDVIYPEYRLKKNKGYPTSLHVRALQDYGPSPLHRLSFAPLCFLKQSKQCDTLKT